jgi:hypothetical protein
MNVIFFLISTALKEIQYNVERVLLNGHPST